MASTSCSPTVRSGSLGSRTRISAGRAHSHYRLVRRLPRAHRHDAPRGSRRILPLWAALLVTLLAARIFAFLPPFEATRPWPSFGAWRPSPVGSALPATAIAVIAGVLAGAATLGKLNIGIFVFLMGAVTVLAIAPSLVDGPGRLPAGVRGQRPWPVAGHGPTPRRPERVCQTGVYQIISGTTTRWAATAADAHAGSSLPWGPPRVLVWTAGGPAGMAAVRDGSACGPRLGLRLRDVEDRRRSRTYDLRLATGWSRCSR